MLQCMGLFQVVGMAFKRLKIAQLIMIISIKTIWFW